MKVSSIKRWCSLCDEVTVHESLSVDGADFSSDTCQICLFCNGCRRYADECNCEDSWNVSFFDDDLGDLMDEL